VEATAAVNGSGEVVSLTDDGVLSQTKTDGYARWAVLVGPSGGAPALDEHGVTYVAGRDLQLYAVDRRGRILWTRELHAQPRGSVVVAPGTAIVALESGEVAWYSRNRGQLLANLATGILPSTAPVLLQGGVVILASTNGEILAFDHKGVRWRRSLATGASIGSLAPDGHGAVIASVADGSIAKVSPDGTIAWQVAAAVSPARSPAFGADGTLFAAAGDDLLAFDAASGNRRWDVAVGGPSSAGLS
jgi:outer membrane protein assembly factor BamB